MPRWASDSASCGHRRGRQGFTQVELLVAVVVIGVLAGFLLHRLAAYQDLAERAAMETTVRLVKTGLQLRLAELIATNRQGEAASLERGDPMDWLMEKPVNYGGVYRRSADRGAWYYDDARAELVYRVRREGGWLGVGADEIRFRVHVLRGVVNVGGTTIESVTGVTLTPVEPYRRSRFEGPNALA